MIKTPFLFTCALTYFILNAPAAKAVSDCDTVYSRRLPDGTHLVAVRAEVPKERAFEDRQGNPLPLIPGAQLPEHLYEYTFELHSPDGAVQRAFGKKKMAIYPGEIERMKFSICDAYVYEGQLVVLYHAGRLTCADVTEGDAHDSRFVMYDDSVIVIDAPESGGFVVGGRLEGSLKAGDLHAIVTTHVPRGTGDRQFLLAKKDGRYKWAQDPTGPAGLPIRLNN